MLKKKTTHNSAIAKKIAALKKGIQTTFPAGQALALNGASVSQPDLLSQLTAQEAPIDLAIQKEGELATARDQVRTTDLARRRFVAALRGALVAYYGRTNSELTLFGINPAVDEGTLTSADAQARAEKAKATREKNGTLGKSQKKALDSKPATPPATK